MRYWSSLHKDRFLFKIDSSLIGILSPFSSKSITGCLDVWTEVDRLSDELDFSLG